MSEVDGYKIQYFNTVGIKLKNQMPVIEVDLSKCTPEEVESWIKMFKEAGYLIEENNGDN